MALQPAPSANPTALSPHMVGTLTVEPSRRVNGRSMVARSENRCFHAARKVKASTATKRVDGPTARADKSSSTRPSVASAAQALMAPRALSGSAAKSRRATSAPYQRARSSR